MKFWFCSSWQACVFLQPVQSWFTCWFTSRISRKQTLCSPDGQLSNWPSAAHSAMLIWSHLKQPLLLYAVVVVVVVVVVTVPDAVVLKYRSPASSAATADSAKALSSAASASFPDSCAAKSSGVIP